MLTLANLAQAQNNWNNVPQLGAKAGLNFSTMKFKQAGYDNGWLTRPVFGLFGNIPVANRVSVQIEGLYSGMGTKIFRNVSQGDVEQRVNYFSVPTLLKFHPGKSFKILAGAEWDFRLNAKSKNLLTGSKDENTSKVNGMDIGLTAGLEYWPFNRVVLGGRYIHGLNDVAKESYIPNSNKNRAVQVSLGYVLAHKAPLAALTPAIPAVATILDKDNDGVADADDKCPDVAGLAKYNGCPIPDSDNDGVNDEQDKCPNVAGLAKYNGCPIPDTDKDGINDEEDKCPTVFGVASYNGCPIPDTDGDGVNDDEDRCKTIPGVAENGGCPKINFNAQNVQFMSGNATLTSGAKAELNKLVTILTKEYPNVRVGIEGHTDNTGKEEANQILSEKRAAAVKTYLVSKKIDSDRLDAVGYGQSQPIADNSTPEGRAKNRRVAFKVSE